MTDDDVPTAVPSSWRKHRLPHSKMLLRMMIFIAGTIALTGISSPLCSAKSCSQVLITPIPWLVSMLLYIEFASADHMQPLGGNSTASLYQVLVGHRRRTLGQIICIPAVGSLASTPVIHPSTLSQVPAHAPIGRNLNGVLWTFIVIQNLANLSGLGWTAALRKSPSALVSPTGPSKTLLLTLAWYCCK